MQESQVTDTEIKNTIATNGGLWMAESKTVRFRPWDGEAEEQLAQVLHDARSKLEGGRVGKRASLILAHMCAEINGKVFWEQSTQDGSWRAAMPLPEREMVISQMWHTDVLTAFIMLKIDTAMDPNVRFPIHSPYDLDGERTVDWEGDLSQLPFVGSQLISDQLWELELRKPFMMRGKLISKMTMGPMRWAVTEQLELLNPGAANLKTIAASIWEIPEIAPNAEHKRLSYTVADLKRMHKTDISSAVNGLDEHHNGLDSSIEVFDPIARKSFQSSVPWIRADFFDIASK